jgi:class 3 adenylate cyclase/tetratricopeptide (TPR) repeat protein
MTVEATQLSALGPYVPRLVRAWSEERSAPRARSIDGTLVSIDISGFTALAERLQARGKAGAEELVTRISGVFDALIEVAERHGGDVLKFRGDALLLLYAGARHAERGCGAASDMQWTIERVGTGESTVGPFELRMSVGVHSEPVQFLLTQVPHRELVVAGPAATRVFALEDLAEAGEIAISQETAALVDEGWIAGERDGARMMRRLEPGASVLPSPPGKPGRDLELYVPAALRGHLAVTSAEAEHRQVTVAFLKLSGTDELLAREGPDALLARVDAVSAAVSDACDAYGITWLESDIDADAIKIYLTAGAPITAGDDSEAMLRALRDILAADTGLDCRAGVNRGHVFTGDIGAASRSTYAVMGDAVNLAARLTGRAEPGEILVTADVLDMARTRFETSERTFQVKGKSLPVVAHALGAALGPREDAQSDMVPLVGREDELLALETALEQARAGRPTVVELVAEPGMGKSRLVREICARADGVRVVRVAAEQYAQAEPYATARDVFRSLLGIAADAPPADVGARVAEVVAETMPDLAPWLPLLVIPFGGIADPTPETRSLDPATSRERLLRAVSSFAARAMDSPTMLVVEDAHWLDDASAFLIAHLLEDGKARPWFVLATSRPSAASSLPGISSVRIELGPLDEELSTALALAVAAEHGLPPEAVREVARRGTGNPLFLRELAFAARHGSLESIPDSIESLLTMRFDALEPPDRLLLRYASVFGPSFEISLVEEAVGEEMPSVADAARWTRLGEFVVPVGETTLAFRHDLVRATAYEGLSFRRRRDIHSRVGHALVRRLGDRAGEEAALLSLHFHFGGQHEHAWRYSVLAADQAAAGFANVVAGELYGRALEAAEHLERLSNDEVAAVAESRGDVLELAAFYEMAGDSYRLAFELVLGEHVSVMRLQRKQGILLERLGRYDEAEAWFDGALATATDVGEDSRSQSELAELELEYAVVLYRRGRYPECFEWSKRAAARAEGCGDLKALAHAYRLLDSADRAMGGLDASWLERALPLYDRLGDRLGRAIVLNNQGIRAYYAGRWVEAESSYEQSRAIENEVGDVVRAATASNNAAEILLDQGHVERAEALFHEALEVYRRSGYSFGAAVVTMNLGRCAAAARRFSEAHALFDEAEAELAAIGSDSFVLETGMRRAEALVQEGRSDEAWSVARTVVERSRDAGELPPREASLERVLGLARLQLGDAAGGATHLNASLEAARALEAEFEIALTLRAIAACSSGGAVTLRAESDEILERLGVVRVPSVSTRP